MPMIPISMDSRGVPPAPVDRTPAFLRLGFRPFYLLAALFAALSVALWAAQYAGWLGRGYLTGPLGHAHEMVFGFTLAVIVGFLFTAVRNWTGLPTPTGLPLAAIALLWVVARILALTPYVGAAAAANVAFPLAAALGIGVPLVRSGNRRNLFFVVLLAFFAAATAATHLAQLGRAPLSPWSGIRVALDVVLLVITVIAGRVVPMFTNNAIPGAGAGRHPLVEKASIASAAALLLADLAGVAGTALAAVLVVAVVAHGMRLGLWMPHRTLRTPLVWILHAGYAWLVAHLALRALAALDLVAAPVATHALTVGAIGALTLGMMTRTARGHTGRPLEADRWEVAAYVFVLAAAAVRVAGPLVVAPAYLWTVELSAVVWSAAFGIYAVRYWPVLTRPRVDGRAG